MAGPSTRSPTRNLACSSWRSDRGRHRGPSHGWPPSRLRPKGLWWSLSSTIPELRHIHRLSSAGASRSHNGCPVSRTQAIAAFAGALGAAAGVEDAHFVRRPCLLACDRVHTREGILVAMGHMQSGGTQEVQGTRELPHALRSVTDVTGGGVFTRVSAHGHACGEIIHDVAGNAGPPLHRAGGWWIW